MSVRRHLVVSAALIALLGLTGCGGDDDEGGSTNEPADTSGPSELEEEPDDGFGEEPDSGEAPDACALITPDEAAAVLQTARPDDTGFEVTTEGSVVGEGTMCVYSWTSDFAVGSFDVSVFPTSLYFDDGTTQTPLPGIGDNAFEQMDNYYAEVGAWMVHIVNVQLTEEAPVELLAIAAGRVDG